MTKAIIILFKNASEINYFFYKSLDFSIFYNGSDFFGKSHVYQYFFKSKSFYIL
ncbi:hypothetical protein LEP1GSC086_2535 [Leptospira weilii str. LNT 1234]|nr:hypothetical protein LEP1GSC086_2535 [Leptospira weilii str. LNT 1234]